MSQDNNLTVLVKKTDGTFKRVLLSDLKKKKEDNTLTSPNPSLKRGGASASSLSKGRTEVGFDKKEEIDFDLVPETRSSSNLDKKQVQKVSVDRSAILDGYNSDVKVKKEDNTLTSPNSSLKRGGLSASSFFKGRTEVGFDKKDSSVALPREPVLSLPKGRRDVRRTEGLKEKLNLPKLTSKDFKSLLEEDLPEIYHKPGKLTKTTPFNAFVHKPENKVVGPLRRRDVQRTEGLVQKEKSVSLSSIIKQKVPMHDVVSKTKIYGPLEEIQNFTLVDLRRLSTDVGEAVSRFQQKFINVKGESIILYLKVMDVWLKSPLYKEYISKISDSLSKGINLEKVLFDSKGITLQEIKALAIMNKTLEI